MKSRILNSALALLAALIISPASASAATTQIDPVLTGALATQFQMLKRIFDRRDSTQKKIIAAEATVTLAYTRMHQVEDSVLKYMRNVQSAFNNLYQIKRAAELVAVDIPKNMGYVRKAISDGGLQGTLMSAIVGKQITSITTDIASLYPFMAQLVTSGSYAVQDIDANGNPVTKSHKVNLLNSSERFYVANTILTKLEDINTSLYCLAWEIRTYRWRSLFYGLDPVGWSRIMSAKWIVRGIISDWNYEVSKANW